jgi:cell wall-associated NlpC family hydrolase
MVIARFLGTRIAVKTGSIMDHANLTFASMLSSEAQRTAAACLTLAALSLAACTSAPRYVRAPSSAVAVAGPNRQEIVRLARSFIGTPYRNGGETRSGMDCSGLVVAVFLDLGISLPRTSLDQARAGEEILRSQMKPGDLVFFKTSSSKPISHVGIYIGRGHFVHASTRARRVRIDSMGNSYFRHRFVTARRILNGDGSASLNPGTPR